MPLSGRALYGAPNAAASKTPNRLAPRKSTLSSSSRGASFQNPAITPMATFETIELASASGGMVPVKGKNLVLAPFNFPDGLVGLKKLSYALGSVGGTAANNF